MPLPELLRDAGMAAAEDHADPRLRLMVDALIQEAIDSGEWFSANDIRNRMPVVGKGLVGARVRAFSMRRPQVMWAVGRVPSNLLSTHGKEIIVWQGPSGSTAARRLFGGMLTTGTGLVPLNSDEQDFSEFYVDDDDAACHCGERVTFGFDGDPYHHRGMCIDCDAVRCDAHPGACGR